MLSFLIFAYFNSFALVSFDCRGLGFTRIDLLTLFCASLVWIVIILLYPGLLVEYPNWFSRQVLLRVLQHCLFILELLFSWISSFRGKVSGPNWNYPYELNSSCYCFICPFQLPYSWLLCHLYYFKKIPFILLWLS